MQSSEETDLTQAVGAVFEALRMKAVSFHVLVLFWKFFNDGKSGPAALNRVSQT